MPLDMRTCFTPFSSASSEGFWSCVTSRKLCFCAYSTISLSFAPLRPASWAVCASQPRVSKYSFSPAYISSRRSFNVFFLFFLV